MEPSYRRVNAGDSKPELAVLAAAARCSSQAFIKAADMLKDLAVNDHSTGHAVITPKTKGSEKAWKKTMLG